MTHNLKVFKFGGASVVDAPAIKNVASILTKYKDQSLVIVISAMGKTTNALEEVVNAHAAKNGLAGSIFETVKEKHYSIMRDLFDPNDEVFTDVNDIFVEGDWVLDEVPHEDYDYMYDQIVSIGELVSTKIVAAYLNKVQLPTSWLDARDIIACDNTFREGRIDWEKTAKSTVEVVTPLLEKTKFVLTQGFIGSTSENFTITLGREGSDYSAAIISFCLNAESMSIWKDVPGVLTADPRYFENVTKLDRLSYKEAIEMTYYGATVIHPKTIKPLQNKNIPLYVKSFIDPEGAGTLITNDVDDHYPPIVIVERNQALLYIGSKDYSFIAEHHLSHLFGLFDKHRIWVNMMRNTAISFMVCVPNQPERLKGFFKEVEEEFSIVKEENVELVTIRHYQEDIIKEMKKGKIVLLEERIRKTFQMVNKSIPIIKPKQA
ncbi:MAG: aspartate kinase [Saprospiraceae bacterium]